MRVAIISPWFIFGKFEGINLGLEFPAVVC